MGAPAVYCLMSFLDPPQKPVKTVDFRAWILAGVILLLAGGGYFIWFTRPRAGYTGRSLSASGKTTGKTSSAQPATKSLHIEGCKEDFIINPGEIVEPRLAPGTPLEQFRELYGKEMTGKELAAKQFADHDPRSFHWATEAFELGVTEPGPNQPNAAIQMSLNSGHIIESLDGIELGLDSFGTILRKMRDRKVEIHERIRHADGHWIYTLTLYSSCGHKFRSAYSRSLPDDPEASLLINRRVTGSNGQGGLLRSDIFMNKVVYDYSIETANGSDYDPAAGEPSEHD